MPHVRITFATYSQPTGTPCKMSTTCRYVATLSHLPPHSSTLTQHRVPRPTTTLTPRLLAIRVQRGFTQRVLAERSGIDRATVARLEAGGQARMDTLSKLAEALGVEPGDLMRDPPER